MNLNNQPIIMKSGESGIILESSPYSSREGEYLIQIKPNNSSHPSTYLASKAFELGTFRFVDGTLNERFSRLLESFKQQKAKIQEQEEAYMARDKARLHAIREKDREIALKKKELSRILCVKDDHDITHDGDVSIAYMFLTKAEKEECGMSDYKPYGEGVSDKGETYLHLENFIQFSKVYPQHVDEKGNPTQAYFNWRAKGFASKRITRYPMGKEAKPLYTLFYEKAPDGTVRELRLNYIQSRKKLLIPYYAKNIASKGSWSLSHLKEHYKSGAKIYLVDSEAYEEVDPKKALNNPNKIMGYSFIIKMLIRGDIEVIDGQLIDRTGILK